MYVCMYVCTYLATEALWMPLSPEGSDEALHDGPVAPLATRSILLVVALTTERLPVFLMETLGSEMFATQSAEEVLGMPSLVQSTHHTLQQREGGKWGQAF